MRDGNNILVARHEDDDREVVVKPYATKEHAVQMDLWFALGRYLDERGKDETEEHLLGIKEDIIAMLEEALIH